MKYTYPHYYKEFKCIADKCPDTCCAGWQIVIDDDSLEKYKTVHGDAGKMLKEKIDWQEETFRQDKDRRCAFLNSRNLCDLYTALGKESLCETCTNYPRHIEEYENEREITLSLSCPEVAKILMDISEKVTFYTEEDDKEDEDFECFDHLMFGILQDVRHSVIKILQNRKMDMNLRLAIIWQMSEEMQRCADDMDIFDIEEILSEYISDNVIDKVRANMDAYMENVDETYNFALKTMKHLFKLEVLSQQWAEELDETTLNIYGKGAGYYASLKQDFGLWLSENMPEWSIYIEQIVVYFVSTYFCGAVYDGWLVSKIKMAIVSGFYIHELLMSRWITNRKELSFDDVVNIVYRYSRELEHSDINLNEMEECLY